MQEQTLLERVKEMRAEMCAVSDVRPGWLEVLAETLEALAQVHDPVTSGLKALSYSEMEALATVVAGLPEETGGLLVASQLADRKSITRSVIVNTLRKMESAGVMQCRSLGMKGTHIKLLGGLTVRVLLERIEKFNRKVA